MWPGLSFQDEVMLRGAGESGEEEGGGQVLIISGRGGLFSNIGNPFV